MTTDFPPQWPASPNKWTAETYQAHCEAIEVWNREFSKWQKRRDRRLKAAGIIGRKANARHNHPPQA